MDYKFSDTENSLAIKDGILKIMEKYPEVIQTHGFYVDEDKKIISIDIIITFDCNDADAVYENVKNEIQNAFPEYSVQIILDRDYSLT